MSANRQIPDLANPNGQSDGAAWTGAAGDSIEALWQLNGGILLGVAETNALTANIAIGGFTSYSDGLRIGFVPVASNTTVMTINLNEVGVKPLVDPDGEPLTGGSVVQGRFTEAVFYAADDHFRLATSGGTTNVTVVGGIILQRSALARLAVTAGPSTVEVSIGAKAFQCQYDNSRVVIEGNNSRVTGAGAASVNGTVLALYVDDLQIEVFADQCQEDSHSSTAFYFEYVPGDTDSHTYQVKVASTIAATHPAGSNCLHCSEFSPNA